MIPILWTTTSPSNAQEAFAYTVVDSGAFYITDGRCSDGRWVVFRMEKSEVSKGCAFVKDGWVYMELPELMVKVPVHDFASLKQRGPQV